MSKGDEILQRQSTQYAGTPRLMALWAIWTRINLGCSGVQFWLRVFFGMDLVVLLRGSEVASCGASGRRTRPLPPSQHINPDYRMLQKTKSYISRIVMASY